MAEKNDHICPICWNKGKRNFDVRITGRKHSDEIRFCCLDLYLKKREENSKPQNEMFSGNAIR